MSEQERAPDTADADVPESEQNKVPTEYTTDAKPSEPEAGENQPPDDAVGEGDEG